MAIFTAISLRIRLILSEFPRIQGKRVNNLNRAFLEDTDFLAKLGEHSVELIEEQRSHAVCVIYVYEICCDMRVTFVM